MRMLLTGIVLLGLVGSAHAASITRGTHTGTDGKTYTDIIIKGEIKFENEKTFYDLAHSVEASIPDNQVMVELDSPGGNVLAGLHIAEKIHQKGWPTWVPKETLCSSICGAIWLSGVARWSTNSSLIH